MDNIFFFLFILSFSLKILIFEFIIMNYSIVRILSFEEFGEYYQVKAEFPIFRNYAISETFEFSDTNENFESLILKSKCDKPLQFGKYYCCRFREETPTIFISLKELSFPIFDNYWHC